MKKFFMIYNPINSGVLQKFDTLKEAREEACRQTKTCQIIILEAIEATKVPVPLIEIESIAGE